jgi:hypothetical protein
MFINSILASFVELKASPSKFWILLEVKIDYLELTKTKFANFICIPNFAEYAVNLVRITRFFTYMCLHLIKSW